MIKRGIRGHDVRASGLEQICKRCGEVGIDYIQLVLEKSIEGFGYGQYSEEYAKKIKQQLGDRRVAILGSYINPSNPDDEALRYDIARFKEKIQYAKTLCPIAVGTETGTYIAGKTNTEEAYQRVLGTVRELVAEAERCGVNVGIEGVHLYVINTPKTMKRLNDEVNSENIKVIFDPMNYINDENYERQDEMICELFDLLHDKVIALHAKDFKIVDGHVRFTPPFKDGLLNYPLIFKKMAEYGLDIPIITEEIDESTASTVFEEIEKMQK